MRSIRPVVTALALVAGLLGVAACGIDEDKVAASAAEDPGGDSTTTGSTTTTGPQGPDISLPDIPPDVTEPDETVPDPTEPEETVPSGETTPGGLTPEALQAAFVDVGFTEDQAICMSIGVFATIDGEDIDALATGDDALIDPAVQSEFEEIVQTCVQGG